MQRLFAYGFRIFFLSASGYAVVLMAAWLAHLIFSAEFGGSRPFAWHFHEMLFGVVSAAIAGFLLTAVPNWTKRPPVHGRGLALLWMLWLAARIGYLVLDPSAADGLTLVLRLVDLAFLPALALDIARERVESGGPGAYGAPR